MRLRGASHAVEVWPRLRASWKWRQILRGNNAHEGGGGVKLQEYSSPRFCSPSLLVNKHLAPSTLESVYMADLLYRRTQLQRRSNFKKKPDYLSSSPKDPRPKA